MSCEAIRKQLLLFPYNELSFEQEEQVQDHLAECEACRNELTLIRQMHSALDQSEAEPAAEVLAGCRRNLRLSVAALSEQSHPLSPKHSLLARLLGSNASQWFAPRWSLLYKPAGALALVAIGFFGARFLPASDAGTQRSRFEPVASRVRYVEPNDRGQVQIFVEETRQRVLSGNVNDEPIQRLLLVAARESADPGVRVETVGLLRNHADSTDVRRALLHALRHDPNAGVRLKALEGLRAFADEPDTRTVLAEVLLKDTNPGVRTQAIDLLTQTREPSIVGVLQEVMTREDNNYVRLKCQKILHELNASVETF
ncbi:MAG TPA: HEAT repeat domain-containing protein [Bryobacteraceae bacterium]|nr:HEAT repeat domain-containing protein [Bryobacteraceae bacterium]